MAETAAPRTASAGHRDDEAPASRGAWITLAVLVLVYVFNFVDRQILAILAQRIKVDLGVTDAQLGFLYGTAFAVFYAVFGIPLGLLADLGNRRSLIAVSLGFWSLMTALSGFARNFPQLALARIGVGIGEASASPAAYSLLSDLFPKRQRATALALYSSGIYIGAGLGLFIGGLIVERWDLAFGGVRPPLGLSGWQVAFLVVGLPGLLLSPLVGRIPEPVRGSREGLVSKTAQPHPVRAALLEAAALLPPGSWIVMAREGGPWVANMMACAGLGLVAFALSAWSGNWQQWIAVAFGALVAFTYAGRLRRTDPPAHALIFRTPSLLLATLGFASLSFNGYVMSFWVPPFYVRYYGLGEAEIGLVLGAISSLCGLLGVVTGGILADRWRRKSPAGRLYVGLANALVPIPFYLASLYASTATISLAIFAVVQTSAALWLGAGTSTVQDLVLPRMRARASAVFLLFVTLLGLAMGPFVVGRLSDLLGDLRLAIITGLSVNLLAAAFFLRAARTVGADESSREERARAAGEPRS